MSDRRKTHRCPSDICRMFDGDEASKQKGRAMAIRWCSHLSYSAGDVIWMPEARSGALLKFVAQFDHHPSPEH